MAPRKKKVEDQNELMECDITLLADIQDATNNKQGFGYYDKENLTMLEQHGLIQINNDMRNGKKVAARITNEGIKFMAKKNVEVAPTGNAPIFSIGNFNVNNVQKRAKSTRRGRQSVYKFDELNSGQYIFVPCNEKHPTSEDMVKSLAGTIAAVNRKYSEETGETKTVSRKAKGASEKTTKVVPVTRQLRQFKAFEYVENGVAGAALVRIDGMNLN